MAAKNFAISLALTLGYEGEWSDNPADPGGATMYGVTQRTYDAYRTSKKLPLQSVRLMSTSERFDIYQETFWTPCGCDVLPSGVDYALFDFAVNSGLSRAVMTLQSVLGVVQDGRMGPQTVTAALSYCEKYQVTALSDALCVARSKFLQTLPTYRAFGEGWMTRIFGQQGGAQLDDTGVLDRAFDLAQGIEPVLPTEQRQTSTAHETSTGANA